MSAIPLIDLREQDRAIQAELEHAIRSVVESGQFILGPEVAALERELASYCGTTAAVAVASGTDALELSLQACGVGPGDEVITTSYGFIATVEAITAVGAVPVFVDIDPVSFTLDPAELPSRITPRTKAILPVHLYGHPCAMDRIMAVARAHHLLVIEDCAQAIGATFRGQRVGGFGEAGCLSFYPSKNLGGYGDGGMVVTNDAAVAEQIQLLRNHGSRERYHHLSLGTNSRLDELQAAILRVKLRHLDRWTEARRRNAARYHEAFAGQGLDTVELPRELPDCVHVYHLYTVRLRHRDRVQEALAHAGIVTQVAYPSTLPAQPALQSLLRTPPVVPKAEAAAREVLSLPMSPALTEQTIARIVDALAHAVHQPSR